MREIATADALLDALRDRGCTVFGHGYVATMFWMALEERGEQNRVRGCMASDPTPDARFQGMPVRRMADVKPAEAGLVCVAVHASIRESVCMALAQAGFTEVVWVYPFLHELLFGPPLIRNARVSLRCILNAQDPDEHWIAVRSLAAQALRDGGADAEALDAYVAAQELHCSRATAQKRLVALEGLVDSFAKQGFDEAHPVLLDTNLRIVDGLHRIALAWLVGADSVICNFVAPSTVFERLFTKRNRLTSETLAQLGLSDGQLERIEQVNARLLDGAFPRPAISVVIPVYNVADYLDQCFESLVAQTFGDFEALLIDDGSTDGSGERCEEWAARDVRFQYVRKQNGGVSSCRNLGIDMARGTYLAFVDPDDWLDERYLEKLHTAAEREDSLFAECDIWRYDNRTGKKIHRSCGQRMGVPYTLEEHMKYGPTASYKAISRRSLWVENEVRFPDCNFESPAVFALVLALAGERAAYVPEPLYYYRRFRENSLVETAYAKTPGVADNTLGIQAMAYLMAQFRARGLYERFAEWMPGLVAYRLNDILAMQYHRRSAQDFAQLVANQRAFLEEAFPTLPRGSYLTWGGYNLNRIMQHLPLLNDPSCRFNFSSAVSVALGAGNADVPVQHPNRYRAMMLERELRQDVWEVARQEQPRYVFMDFIDERFDLLAVGDRYITASDAYQQAEIPLSADARIAFGSPEHRGLWRRAFPRFLARLHDASPNTQVVIMENYLAERVGSITETREYENVDEIRAVNAVLRWMYETARTACPNAIVVPTYTCPDYFTDEAYEYGAIPSHLNEIVNQRIAAVIWSSILAQDQEAR